MEYEWDEAKEAHNRAKHKIGFDAVKIFDWDGAVIVNRSRHVDGEPRFAAVGSFGDRIHTIVFTWREDRIRIISFRRANKPEEKIYEREKI